MSYEEWQMNEVKLTKNIHENFDTLLLLIDTFIEEAELKGKYIKMLTELERDQMPEDSKVTFLGFKRAPAARGYHHNFEGGLVYHLIEMWNTWTIWRDSFALVDKWFITNDRILRAIINHDLHKGYATYILKRILPFETEYGHHSSKDLLTKDSKSISILSKFGISLDGEMMNALLWAEGGFAIVQPEARPALSVLAYLLDEFSANVVNRIEKGTMLDVAGKLGIFKRL
jgi:hypothetical protein